MNIQLRSEAEAQLGLGDLTNHVVRPSLKKVRFDDTEMDRVPDDASFRERKLSQFPRSDAPKTSEYAYFMNTKNGAVQGHSCSYARDNGQSKNFKANPRGREDIKPSNIPKASSKDLRFSDRRETAGHFDCHLLLTPPVPRYEEPSQRDIKGLLSVIGAFIREAIPVIVVYTLLLWLGMNAGLTRNIRERPLLISENVTPAGRNSSLSTLREASENASLSGNQWKEKGIFPAKRQRLRESAYNSISEVEKLHPEGFGLISSLLSRLYHKCDESDLFYPHDSSKREIGNGCKAHISCEFKNVEERLRVSHRREWDMELPKICFGGHRNRVFLERDAYFSGSPFTNYVAEARSKDGLMDLRISSKDHKSSSSHVEHDLPFCLPFERYGYSSSCYLKELDGSCSPIECQRKEPHRFLLKWDFESDKDGFCSSFINYEPAKIYSPGLSTTWNVNHQQIVDQVPDDKALCSPSLFSNYHLQYNSIQSYPMTSYFTPDFVPNFDEAKCSVLRTEMPSLTFPSMPCLTSTEATNAENIPYSSNMIFSFGDQRRHFWPKGFKDADFSMKNPSIFRTLQFPQSDDSLHSFSIPKKAPGEIFSFCSEDAIHNHSQLLNFSSSLDNTTNRPLLLENVSNDWSNREVYFDDDNKWNYLVDVVP
ncbi:uncharacterized protein LOC142522199 isoform X3 [Primulina tabacum]|uniref:uncharacterized protein LOC142522199 isoform X3 n=1 Tax=Primulina tabacum TaxID=48773 RepID=UPI003F5A1866